MGKQLTKFQGKFKAGVVDRESNIIHGMTLIQGNREALGHEMFIDEKFVRSVVKQGKETGDIGLKARFDHPSACFSSMGSQIGRFKNFRMKEDRAIADLHLAPFAFASNPNGNLGEFLMDAAENDPDIMGNSIVFRGAEPENFRAGDDDNPDDPEFLFPHARLEELHGCDVVDQGAATDGMFSIFGRPNYMAEQAELWIDEHPEILKTILEPIFKKFINQNQSIMSDDNKSLLERVKEAIKSEPTAKDVVVDAPEVDYNAEKEALEASLTAKDAEILSLSEGFKVTLAECDESFNAEVSVKDEALTEALTAIEDLKSTIADLKKESLGTTVDPIASTDDSVDLSDEAKADLVAKTKDEEMAFQASEHAKGNTFAQTYINSNK